MALTFGRDWPSAYGRNDRMLQGLQYLQGILPENENGADAMIIVGVDVTKGENS
jgi:hypothetical protein